MKVKCEYCDSLIEDTDAICPHCGAPNEHMAASAEGVPKTIEELKQFCARHNLPLKDMRFFIGENTIQAKAFGIYYDQGSGEYVVYKNKANGDRAVRYHGQDEAYAVNEIYQKMKSEISNQRTYQANKAMAAGGGPAHGGYNFNKKKSRSFWSILLTFVKFFGIGILALGIISIAYVLFVAPDNGYYTYGGTNYYLQGNDWYYYDTSVNDWQRDTDPPSELTDDAKQYYDGRDWTAGNTYTDFTLTDYYDDSYYSSDSSDSGWSWDDDDDWDDSDWDWDSGDSWDSGATDWDSDW